MRNNHGTLLSVLILRAITFTMLFSFTSICCFGSAKSKYTSLIEKVSPLSSEKLLQMAENYQNHQEDDKALVLYMVVCNRFKDVMTESEKQSCSLAHLKAGNIFFIRGSYTNALEMYVKGLKIAESCKEQKYVARFYNNIGNVYCMFLDYEKGINYYLTGYKYRNKYKDKFNEYNIATNLTGLYTLYNNAKEARKYYYASEKLKDISNPVNCFMSKLYLAMILNCEKKYGKAKSIFLSLIDYAKKKKLDSQYLCSAYQQTYKVYDNMNNRDSTLYYMQKCYDYARETKILYKYASILFDYSKFYEKTGDVSKAQLYKTRYLTLKDSIFNDREFDAVKNTQFLYEMDKTSKEISELHVKEVQREQTIRFQRIMMSGLVIGVIIVSFFLHIVYRQKKKLDKSYRNLFLVNRNFVETQEQMKLRLKRELDSSPATSDDEEDATLPIETDSQNDAAAVSANNDNAKYQGSKLNESQKQALLDAITNVMENTMEFCREDFSLDLLASIVNTNNKYVSQVINESFHKNFSNYVNEYRIHLACKRLTEEKYHNYTIKAIAESVGFKSHATFISVFRKVTGITPSLYQKLAKEEQK